MSGKQSKTQILKMEIAVKDRLIHLLLRAITENKIKLDLNIIQTIEKLYVKKIEKEKQ